MHAIPQISDLIAGVGAVSRGTNRVAASARAAALIVGLLFTNSGFTAINTTMACLFAVKLRSFDLISTARAQAPELTQSQLDAVDAYNKSVRDFKSILSERRAQISAKQRTRDPVENRTTQQICHSPGILRCR
jgi:hypothetical protein